MRPLGLHVHTTAHFSSFIRRVSSRVVVVGASDARGDAEDRRRAKMINACLIGRVLRRTRQGIRVSRRHEPPGSDSCTLRRARRLTHTGPTTTSRYLAPVHTTNQHVEATTWMCADFLPQSRTPSNLLYSFRLSNAASGTQRPQQIACCFDMLLVWTGLYCDSVAAAWHFIVDWLARAIIKTFSWPTHFVEASH